MASPYLTIVLAILVLIQLSTCQESPIEFRPGAFAGIANRNDGTVSIIDDVSEEIVTIEINGTDSEPMYFSFDNLNDQAWVGDRRHSIIYAFKTADLAPGVQPVAEIQIDEGIFHMFSNGKQLWVCSDVANTMSVIKLDSYEVLKVIDMNILPNNIADDFKCHDLVSTVQGIAFVSMLAKDDINRETGYIASFDTVTFELLRVVETCGDPHVFHNQQGNTLSQDLWSPCQVPGRITRFDLDLNEIGSWEYPGVHGIFGDPKNEFLAVGSITNDGVDAARTLPVDDPGNFMSINTQVPRPHNFAYSQDGSKIFITYSGARTQVEIVDIDVATGGPAGTSRVVETGENPFGIMLIPKVVAPTNPSFDVTGLTLIDSTDGSVVAVLDLSQPYTEIEFAPNLAYRLEATTQNNDVEIFMLVLTERSAGFNVDDSAPYESFVFEPLEGEVYIEIIPRSRASGDLGEKILHKLLVQQPEDDFLCLSPHIEEDGSCNCVTFSCEYTSHGVINCDTSAWYCAFFHSRPESVHVSYRGSMCTCML